jgi:hypothetical protein
LNSVKRFGRHTPVEVMVWQCHITSAAHADHHTISLILVHVLFEYIAI